MTQWKIFGGQAWAALKSSLRSLKGAVDGNASAVSGLGMELAEMAETTAAALDGKQDKLTDGPGIAIEDNAISVICGEDAPKAAGAASAGTAESVSRSDHIHPAGMTVKFAENSWGKVSITNLLPDTTDWVMSNGCTPDVVGDYGFEATFTSAWEGFSCFFDGALLNLIRGKTIKFGVDTLIGASARLELVVDGNGGAWILETNAPRTMEVAIPDNVASVTLRAIIFSEGDLHCKFTGVRLYDKLDEDAAATGDAYLTVRKVRQENIPPVGVSGTLYITEQGGVYFAGDGGQVIPLHGGGGAASPTQAIFSAGTTAPENTGLLWIDTGAGVTKYYNGSDWATLPVAWG